MSDQSKQGHSLITGLLIVAGAILLLAGVINLLPAVNAANEVAAEDTPTDFGNDALPLRPTVTPLPYTSQMTLEPEPVLLPDTSAPVATVPVRKPTPVDLTGGIPTRLIIPSLKLDAPIETVGWHTVAGVSQWDVPDHFAAGWLKTSAQPGQPGNTVLDGHHNIAGEVFRRLVDLRVGDELEVYAGNNVFFYKVTTRQILKERGQPLEVRIKNAQWIQPTEDERLTLVTCWPYTTNSHRLIIVAKPVAGDRAEGNPKS